jgi:uncharacterized membrane protein YkoI
MIDRSISTHKTEGTNMKKSIKLLSATALLAVIVPLSAYAATSASATKDKAAPATAVAAQSAQNDAEIADAAEQPGAETPEAVDPNEQANLEKAAQITKQQAIDVALKQVSGTVKEAALEDENGVIVYNVHIVDANGKGSEVKVDAKTGSVTKSEGDNNVSSDGETNDGGNSDGETNDGN